MNLALMLLGVALFPVAGLGLLLWLSHLEETLPRDVRSARCAPPPPPILAIPVRRPVPATTVTTTVLVPSQRTPVTAQREASTALSLGGSTNR